MADGASFPVSVVIPALDAAETIVDQLTALAQQDWAGSWEVVVADNGSTDDTVSVAETLRDRFASFRVVDASGRRGGAHARNEGARHAKGRLLLFCDADDVVDGGWLAAMVEALEDHVFVAPRFDFGALNPDHLSASRGDPQAECVQVLDYPPYLPHAGGSGLGIRREVFEGVRGFDESLLYGEDTDLCIRVQLSGSPLTFAPLAAVQVRLPRSSRRQFRQAYRWAMHNAFTYLRYRPVGHRPHRPWRNYGVEVLRLLKTGRRLIRPEKRASWLFRAGWDLGLLSAAVKYRMPPIVSSSLRQPQVSSPSPPSTDETGRRERSA